MSLANLIVTAATGAGGGGFAVAIIQSLFSYRGKRADAAKAESEAEALDRDTWFKEAEDVFAKVKKECDDCKTELRQAEERHRVATEKLRLFVTEVRDALIGRADAIDELLPYVQGLPEEKMREIRAANRAVRAAVWRVQV